MASQTAADIAYLAGYEEGIRRVTYLTLRLYLAYGIIGLLLIVTYGTGVKAAWRR